MFVNNSTSNLCSTFVSLKKLEKVNKPTEEEPPVYLKKVDNYFKTKSHKIPKRFRLLEKYKNKVNKNDFTFH